MKRHAAATANLRGFDYAKYLESEAWAIRRQWKLDAADNRCQLCDSTDKLQVHHRTYARVGNERERDLIVLCGECHAHFHGIESPPETAVRHGAHWGEHTGEVNEINREIRRADPSTQLALLEAKLRLRRTIEAEARERAGKPAA